MGIWNLLDEKQHIVKPELRLTSGEGNTKVTVIKFCSGPIYLKREDLNPTGSQKDRGLAFQISAHMNKGEKNFVISSSGNSSISAINLLKGKDHQLVVFLSPKISSSKSRRIEELLNIDIDPAEGSQIIENISIIYSNRAVSDAFKYSKKTGYVLLRGSTDPFGTVGYSTIATELNKQVPNGTDIFIPTSSGTTAEGIFEGYRFLRKNEEQFTIPKFHICQTTKVNILARDFSLPRENSESSLADSIVDRVGHRKKRISEIITQTRGEGWVISDDEIINAEKILKQHNVNCSYEGAVALASYQKALDNGRQLREPILLITGTKA